MNYEIPFVFSLSLFFFWCNCFFFITFTPVFITFEIVRMNESKINESKNSIILTWTFASNTVISNRQSRNVIHVKAMFKNCITICICTVPLHDSKNQKISQNTSNTLCFALFFNSTIIGAFFKTQWNKLDSLNAHATPQFAWNNFWLNDIMWRTWKK